MLCILLLISGMEVNPGPRKMKKHLDKRTSSNKKKMQEYRSNLAEEEILIRKENETDNRSQRECGTKEQIAEYQRDDTAGRKRLRFSLSEQESISSNKGTEHRHQKVLT